MDARVDATDKGALRPGERELRGLAADHLQGIQKFEAELWKIADNLRANSNLASNEYFMPIMGLIFMRYATNRYYEAKAAIEADKAAGRMPDRPLVQADFTRRRALMLPKEACFDVILKSPKDGKLGVALTEAMEAIEQAFPPLAGQLPKDYTRFEDSVLEEMMRTFDSEGLRKASGDVFGRIYEYFLAEFSKQRAHDNGEFFTPPSIVQTIVNVIEPDHGIVFDPACGSGGMFVQTSHFMENAGQDTMKRVTFYGHEKNETTAKLAQINLAVHGLQGSIRSGNEAITYYKDPFELVGKCDFVMANPPFNVDEVDAEKIKGDKRLPFGLPGVNKAKKVSNANYLWISYFYSYLNETGRAGFVMSSQASSAGREEAAVRRKLIETGAVDIMIDIRGNFFYTRTVPCQLWFLDRAKEKDEARRDYVLMIDARNIYRKVSRAIYDFSPEQQKNIAAIVWLYRGQSERYLKLQTPSVRRAHAPQAKTYGTSCDSPWLQSLKIWSLRQTRSGSESHRDDSVSHGKATVQNSVLVKRKRFFGVDSTKRRLAHLLTPRPRTKEGHRIRPCGAINLSQDVSHRLRPSHKLLKINKTP